MTDVIIIGGGVIGCAIARELTRYRIDVALVEGEVEVGFGTSKSNSGIIHGGTTPNPARSKVNSCGPGISAGLKFPKNSDSDSVETAI